MKLAKKNKTGSKVHSESSERGRAGDRKGGSEVEWRMESLFSISDVTCTERRYNVRERVYVDDKERIEAWPNVPLTVRSFYDQTLTYLADQNGVFAGISALAYRLQRSVLARLWLSFGKR